MSELKQDFNKTLLPCPFCPKGQARLQRRGHGYYVICKSCGCRTPLFQYQFDSREKLREQAIEAWNQRKPMDDIVERLEDYGMWKELLIYDLTHREREIIKKAIEIVKAGGVE